MNSIDINLKNVSKSYDGKKFVIDGIDLYIPAGQRTILLVRYVKLVYNKFMFCIQSGVQWILAEKSEKLCGRDRR